MPSAAGVAVATETASAAGAFTESAVGTGLAIERAGAAPGVAVVAASVGGEGFLGSRACPASDWGLEASGVWKAPVPEVSRDSRSRASDGEPFAGVEAVAAAGSTAATGAAPAGIADTSGFDSAGAAASAVDAGASDAGATEGRSGFLVGSGATGAGTAVGVLAEEV